MPTHLQKTEWVFLLSCLILIATLFFISKQTSLHSLEALVKAQEAAGDPSKIQVIVQGCVQQKCTLTLPKGSRLCDLKDCVQPLPNADLRIFKRRRLLKNHEVIHVPFKEKTAAND